MNKISVFLGVLLLMGLYLPNALAWETAPHASVGFNSVQGTYFSLGIDSQTHLTQRLSAGLEGYYSAGDDPSNDREIGVGPFLGYIYPVNDFLFAHVREEINYVNALIPYQHLDGRRDSTTETGTLSATSFGVSIFLARFLGLSAGYRWVNALSNSRLDDGRSGFYFGAALMF